MTDSSKDNPLDTQMELFHHSIQDPRVLTPIILIGVSALVPLPLVDDALKAYLEKLLFTTIAEHEGQTLTKEEQKSLTQQPPSGCCAKGCLYKVVLYFPKRLLRKLFFFLEIKRSVDQAATALAQAWLFRLTLHRKWWTGEEDPKECEHIRTALIGACREQGVKPLESAVSHAFHETRGTLFEFARAFTRKATADKESLDETVRLVTREKKDKLSRLLASLTSSLNKVSSTYLADLAVVYERHFNEKPPSALTPPSTPGSSPLDSPP